MKLCVNIKFQFISISQFPDRPTSLTTGSPVTDAGNLGVSTGAETAGFRWDGTTISIASVSLVIITVVVACTLIYLRRSKTETDRKAKCYTMYTYFFVCIIIQTYYFWFRLMLLVFIPIEVILSFLCCTSGIECNREQCCQYCLQR